MILDDESLSLQEGVIGKSCVSETGDLLSASQYTLLCGSAFITPFARIPSNIAPLVKLYVNVRGRRSPAGFETRGPRVVR